MQYADCTNGCGIHLLTPLAVFKYEIELKAHSMNCNGEAPVRNRWSNQNGRGRGSDNDVMRCECCQTGFTQFDELQVLLSPLSVEWA